MYWNFGGSTVMAKKYVRLMAAVQDRSGWLWNEYPLEQENWETHFVMEVFSTPHLGVSGKTCKEPVHKCVCSVILFVSQVCVLCDYVREC